MSRWIPGRTGLLLLALGFVHVGCGSPTASYVHPNADFPSMKRAAVLPFQNLSGDPLAGERMRSIFVVELLQEGVLEIVDPRETDAAMRAAQIPPGTALTPEQSVEMGKKLAVDALFFGVVEEYGANRSERSRGPEVTGTFGMSEVQTGTVVWQTQVHRTGSSIWGKLFGGGPADLYTVSRETVREALRTLL